MSTCFQSFYSDVGLSKAEILEDVCGCISETLSKPDCDFNDAGAWSGYTARVRVELCLHDIDTTLLVRTVKIGELIEPTVTTLVEVAGENPAAVRERLGATVPTLEVGSTRKKRRWYAPRSRKPQVMGQNEGGHTHANS